jgi:hypothetical protein
VLGQSWSSSSAIPGANSCSAISADPCRRSFGLDKVHGHRVVQRQVSPAGVQQRLLESLPVVLHSEVLQEANAQHRPHPSRVLGGLSRRCGGACPGITSAAVGGLTAG